MVPPESKYPEGTGEHEREPHEAGQGRGRDMAVQSCEKRLQDVTVAKDN